MRRVLDRLMISDLSEASDPFFLRQHEVQAILYFGEGGIFGDDIKLYNRPPLADGTLDNAMLCDGIEFLRESLRAGRRVLAVGPTGATIVAGYLAEMGFSAAQAIELLGTANRSGVRPDADAIDELQAELQRRSQVTLGHR